MFFGVFGGLVLLGGLEEGGGGRGKGEGGFGGWI